MIEEQPDGTVSDRMRWLITAQFISQSIYVAAKLGIADLLAEEPRSVTELAHISGTNASALRRVLRLVAAVGIFEHTGEDAFSLNDLGGCLREGVSGSMRSAVLLFCEEPYRAAADLLHTVRTGQVAFERAFGAGHYEYLAAHREAADTFHRAIGELTRLANAAITNAYDFSSKRRIVDVGGGEGHLLVSILKAHPLARGVLLELGPAMAAARTHFATEGLLERCELIEGNFFELLPAGADLYILKSVVHNWDDEQASKLLRRCRQAMHPDARILVIERMITTEASSIHAVVNDIIMMCVTGGAERMDTELAKLFQSAGFTLVSITPTSSGFALIEGRPT